MIEVIELSSPRAKPHRARTMIDKVSFDVYPGQLTALLGPTKSGKSTVLRIMAELQPGRGRTLFSGRPYHALRPPVREVGLALDADAVHPGRTVRSHLGLYAASGGVPKSRIGDVLEIAGLTLQTEERCGRLDAGQRQRLSIAAALLGDPSTLLLDEPRGLDAHGMTWFTALLRAYAAQGRTVLVAAAHPADLAGAADHVVVLRRDEEDGLCRVIASRSAAEVFAVRRASVVVVRSPQAARLAVALEEAGATLATAGPGALEVRGMDRARIGEVAHVAGICLHELADGADDDADDVLSGMRPRRELETGLSEPVDAAAVGTWTSGVRVVRAASEIEACGIENTVIEAVGIEDTEIEDAKAVEGSAAGVAVTPAESGAAPAEPTPAEVPAWQATVASSATGVMAPTILARQVAWGGTVAGTAVPDGAAPNPTVVMSPAAVARPAVVPEIPALAEPQPSAAEPKDAHA